MKTKERVKKVLFLLCAVLCLIGSVIFVIKGIKTTIYKKEFNSNIAITTAQVNRVGLTNRYNYSFIALPDTTTEYYSPRGEYTDYIADSITVKIAYDKTNPKVNKPIGLHNFNPNVDLTIIVTIALIPIILLFRQLNFSIMTLLHI